jgi:Fe2+ transport system protein FeoA
MPTLDQVAAGTCVRLAAIRGDGPLVQRLYEMGLLEGEEVEVVGFAPLGDPMEIRLRDFRLSLRRTEARLIDVEPIVDLS